MVKFIPTKRKNRLQTLDDVQKVKITKEIHSYAAEDKVTRRHRYQTTKQQREKIDINLQRRMEDIHIEQRTDALGSYFRDVIELKRSAICTNVEKSLFNEALALSQSLPILLVNIPKVLKLIRVHLKEKASSNTALELVPYLIKDCREEFYPYFKELLEMLADSINIEIVNQLEFIFLAIAHGIKYLEKSIVDDFDNFITILNSRFLTNKFAVVRRLAGEALAYLLRKKRKLLKQCNFSSEALAYSVYQSVIGAQGFLGQNAFKMIDILWECDPELIVNTYKCIIENVTNEQQQAVVFVNLTDVFNDLQNRPYMYEIYTYLFTYKNGQKVNPPILQLVLNTIQKMGYAIRLGMHVQCLEQIILSDTTFINKFMNQSIDQLEENLEIILEHHKQCDKLYQLILATTMKCLYSEEKRALKVILQLTQIETSCDKFSPVNLEQFYQGSFFESLLQSESSEDLLGLSRLANIIEFPEEIIIRIQDRLKIQVDKINQMIQQPDNQFEDQISQFNSLTNTKLEMDSITHMILCEQDPKQTTLKEGIKLRYLELLRSDSLTPSFQYLYARDTLHSAHYIQLVKLPFELLKAGLASRKRQVRLACAQQLFEQTNNQMFQLMIQIDSNTINLDNEREVKNQINNLAQLKYDECIEAFAYGIAFTKFLLVKQQIRDLLCHVLAKGNITRLFLILDRQPRQQQLSFIEKYCYLDLDEEALDSKLAFDDIFAPALLNATLTQDQQLILQGIAIRYLQNQKDKEYNCVTYEEFQRRRFGEKKQQFYLKLIGKLITKENCDTVCELMKHWLIKDDIQVQLTVINNLQTIELLRQQNTYSTAIQEYFQSLRLLVDGKTFRGELTRIQTIPLPGFSRYTILALYPKIASKQALGRKNKKAAIIARRNAVFATLSTYCDSDNSYQEIIVLLSQQHGFPGLDQPIQIQIEYLKVMKNLLDQLGYQINREIISGFLDIVLGLMNLAFKGKSQRQSSVKELGKVSINRLNQIILKYSDYSDVILTKLQEHITDDCFSQGFDKIVQDSRYQPSSMLKLLTLLVVDGNYNQLLINYSQLMLSKVHSLLELEQTEKIKVTEQEGRANWEIKKENQKEVTKQRTVIREVCTLLSGILQLGNPYEANIQMEIEPSDLCVHYAKNYGAEAIRFLYLNMWLNSHEKEHLIIRNVNVLFLFYNMLKVAQASQQTLIDSVLLLVSTIGNPQFYIEECTVANKLKAKLIHESIRVIVQQLNTGLTYDQIDQIFTQYSQVILKKTDLKTRNMIVKVLITLSSKFVDLYPLNLDAMKLLAQMNERNRSLDELDVERCLDGALKSKELIQNASDNHADLKAIELLLQNALQLIDTPELALRVALQQIFKAYFQNQIINKSSYTSKQLLPQIITIMGNAKSETTIKAAFSILEHHLDSIQLSKELKSIRDQIPLNIIELGETHFAELKFILPEISQLFDIQMHNRIKALQQLQTQVSQYSLLSYSFSKVILPFLEFNILIKGIETTNNKMQLTDQVRSYYSTLSQLSIEIYGQICSSFSFSDRISHMQRLTRLLTREFLQTKPNSVYTLALIKLIAAIAKNHEPAYDVVSLINSRLLNQNDPSELEKCLQQYQYEEQQVEEEIQQDFAFSFKNLIEQEKQLAKARQLEQKDQTTTIWNKVVDISVEEISDWNERSKQLLKSVYHPLKAIYVLQKDHEQDKLRMHLSLALTQVITQLPPDSFMTELNRLLQRMCRALKSRDDDIREQARRSILLLSQAIGPIFLKFTLTTLKQQLNQGFENHVLSYTVSLLVEQITQNGAIDSSLQELVEIFMDEVLGRVSSEKEEENLPKKCKEIKSKKGMLNFKAIGSLIDFSKSLPTLIGIIDHFLTLNQVSHSVQAKLKLIFEHIYLGLIINPSLPKNAINIIYQILAETSHQVAIQLNKQFSIDFTIDTQLQKTGKVDKEQLMTIQLPSQGGNSIVHFMKQNKLKTSSALIFSQTTHLGIKLLHNQLKHHQLDDSPLLKKMFKLVLDCLQYQDMMTDTAAVLCTIIRERSWVTEFRKQIINASMTSLTSLTQSDDQAVRDAFNLLRVIIDQKLTEFTTSQQKQIIHFIDLHLEYQEPLECLRLIIHQIWQLPQIYDLAMRVRELMLQNQKKYQALCRSIYLNFIVKYPLSSTVLQQHFDFLLANLEYAHTTGRQAVYACLDQIFEVFPEETIIKLADISYFALIVALLKETGSKDQLQTVVQRLLSRVPQKNKYLNHSLQWLKSPKDKVLQAGLQSLIQLNNYISIPIETLVTLLDGCIANWDSWKSQIQAQNIQKKNLKYSKWSEVIETIDVSLLPEQANITEDLMSLIISLSDDDLIRFYERDTICKVFKFTSYPNQVAANTAMRILLKSKDLPIMKVMLLNNEFLENNMFKILKYYFLQKYARQTTFAEETLTYEFLYNFMGKVSPAIVEDGFAQLLRITSSLLARDQQFAQAIDNLLEFYKYLLVQGYKCGKSILESVIKIQKLKETTLIQEILRLFEQIYGANDFIKLYSSVNNNIGKHRAEKRAQTREMAINAPEEYIKIRQTKNLKKKDQKKVKLVKKRGKIPLE